MALAKLCACTCGGAIVGGGAVHVADVPPAQERSYSTKVMTKKARVIRKGAPARQAKRIRRVVTRQSVSTCPAPKVTVVTAAQPPMPIPYAPLPPITTGGPPPPP